MTTAEQLHALKGEASLLSLAAYQNVILLMCETNRDYEHQDNADLVLMYWVDGIRTLLTSGEYSSEVTKTFANIGITA